MTPNCFTATYRIQLRADFGFAQVENIVQYLVDLGISHIYTSPFLQSAPKSTHGYDVVDESKINEELGGKAGLERLYEALKRAHLAQIIDVVPNHMSIAALQNPWWWDVLENGPSSRYSAYFDVDWDSSQDRWPNKILLPILEDHYGRVLERKLIEIIHHKGIFALKYRDHILPVDPASVSKLLGQIGLASFADIKENRADLLLKYFNENPDAEVHTNAEVARINAHADLLDDFIEQQNYRLAFWRTAARDLGYRRFFDIKDLVGLNIDNKEAFHAVHKIAFELLQSGVVQGLRIDHPDGLKNPTAYFKELSSECPNTLIVAEKILSANEKLPSEWPVDGTTGYDFLNTVDALFIDPHGKKPLTNLYEEIIGKKVNIDCLVKTCKKLVLTELLDSEINRLTSLFVHICERHRRHRDYARHDLREALVEVAACFGVYRSYVTQEKPIRIEDKTVITQAVTRAIKERSDLDPELLLFLKEILLVNVPGKLETELAFRFQQLTPPTMGKGVEDTFFYRYMRLICLNEVGGNPDRFGITPEKFHKYCSQVLREHPRSILATTTHDTKRSEDVRMRLALLSEIPHIWEERVQNWFARDKKHSIDANTEYLFYQTLVGAWPLSLDRAKSYMQKAVREAKLDTSWTAPNVKYEKAVSAFIQEAYRNKRFMQEVENFVSDLLLPGRINSLSQTLIKLTAPGIPDIYQGSELWNYTLVDPDNRQPVDYEGRKKLLQELERLSLKKIMLRMDEGLPKAWLIRQVLHLRKRHPEYFSGSYKPIYAQGVHADHVVAFMRAGALVTVTPRLLMGLHEGWGDTHVVLGEGRWRNILTQKQLTGSKISMQELFDAFPVAILEKIV